MLTSGEFVEVYVSLLEAERETGSQEEFEARRDQVLEQHETSRDELVRFVEAHAEDPEFLATLWDSIEARLQEVGEEGDPSEETASPEAAETPVERRSREEQEVLEEQKRMQNEETLEGRGGRELPLRRQQQ